MVERKICNSRGTVYYWQSSNWNNSKKTLFFLHGLTADHTMFDSQINYFIDKYNLLTWDAPAHGESRPYHDFSFSDAADILLQIIDERNIESVILIGQSLGGYVAQSFIQQYPERVRAFIGIDTTPYGESYYSKSDKWWLRQIEWMSRLYPHNLIKRSITNQVAVTTNGRKNMMLMLEQYSKMELCHLMGIGYAAFLDENRDIQIQCPVLILIGEHDRTGKVRQYCEQWSNKEGYQLIKIKDAAHNSNVDNPDDVNKVILDFVSNLS